MKITLSDNTQIPIEMHRPTVVQKLTIKPISERVKAIKSAGFNTFLLSTKDVFLDMLTDSGTNAISNQQLAAMMVADEAYAGSQSFDRLVESVKSVFGMKLVLPVHQGRAAEHVIAQTFVKKGNQVPMNFHFTTTRAHIELAGGKVAELIVDEAFNLQSKANFKGNMDIKKLRSFIKEVGKANIPFVRMEVATNLTGGQPVSLQNLKEVRAVCDEFGIMLVVDACLIAENALFIKEQEAGMQEKSLQEIMQAIVALSDLTYFSARKLSASKGGVIMTNNQQLFQSMKSAIPLFEGFFTYGGMSLKEVESMAVGLKEFTDETMISHSVDFINHIVTKLEAKGVPVVTPSGALGAHLDAGAFLPHLTHADYPAGALAAALFVVSGVRTMERGTISMDRDPETGKEIFSETELVRIAVPRRLFTLSQVEFLIDRIVWLHHNRDLIGGLRFVDEPPVLRFFDGRLASRTPWEKKLATKFKADFGTEI